MCRVKVLSLASPSRCSRSGSCGGQLPYSDLATETALPLRLIFNLPLRQTEGLLTPIFEMLGLDLCVSNSQFSRCIQA